MRHAGVLAALRCACRYQAIARIGGVNAPPGDEGFDGITNVNNQAPHHGLARTKRPGLEEAALRFPQMQACSQKALLHKVPLSQRLPEPSEDSLQMLGTQREKTSTAKARLTTLSRMVAIAPMAKTKRYREGAVSSGPISSSSL